MHRNQSVHVDRSFDTLPYPKQPQARHEQSSIAPSVQMNSSIAKSAVTNLFLPCFHAPKLV